MRNLILILITSMVLLSFKKAPPINNLSKKQINDKAIEKYIERFKSTAMTEQELYGIPASITLAQGIVESNAGRSRLSSKHNNHFGMKWRKGRKEKYAVYSDDTPTDKFVVYKSAWRSYRDHSKLLVRVPRYKHLFKLRVTDYKGWAKGLKKSGYATNKDYDKILISIIEKYKLYQYDQRIFYNLINFN